MPALTRKPKNSKKSVLDQIAKLQEAVAEERRKLRELELERQAAGEEVRQARERYIQALQRKDGR
jgi:hypothetical protein